MPENMKPHGADQQFPSATVDAAADATRASIKAMDTATRHAGEAMEQGARATGEAFRRDTQQVGQTIADATNKMTQAARGASEEGLRRMSMLPGFSEGALGDMQQAVAHLAAGVIQANLQAMQELLRLSNPIGVVEIQQRFMHQYMDTLLQGSSALIRAAQRTAEDARRVQDTAADQRFKGAATYRSAA